MYAIAHLGQCSDPALPSHRLATPQIPISSYSPNSLILLHLVATSIPTARGSNEEWALLRFYPTGEHMVTIGIAHEGTSHTL